MQQQLEQRQSEVSKKHLDRQLMQFNEEMKKKKKYRKKDLKRPDSIYLAHRANKIALEC